MRVVCDETGICVDVHGDCEPNDDDMRKEFALMMDARASESDE